MGVGTQDQVNQVKLVNSTLHQHLETSGVELVAVKVDNPATATATACSSPGTSHLKLEVRSSLACSGQLKRQETNKQKI